MSLVLRPILPTKANPHVMFTTSAMSHQILKTVRELGYIKQHTLEIWEPWMGQVIRMSRLLCALKIVFGYTHVGHGDDTHTNGVCVCTVG